MKIKLTGKLINLILCLFSVVIFSYTYFNIYLVNIDKTNALQLEINTVKEQMNQREMELSQIDTVKDNTAKLKHQIDEIIADYPVAIHKEDDLMFVEQLNDTLHISAPAINPADSVVFYTTIIPAVNDDNGEMMTGMQSPLTVNFKTTYEGLKELIEYINDYPYQTTINNVAVSYDSSTGYLTGNMALTRYALTGTGKAYEPPFIDGINIGTDNIFGTSKMPMSETDQ